MKKVAKVIAIIITFIIVIAGTKLGGGIGAGLGLLAGLALLKSAGIDQDDTWIYGGKEHQTKVRGRTAWIIITIIILILAGAISYFQYISQ